MPKSPRISGPTLKVLRLLMENPESRRAGSEITTATGIKAGTLYPLLQRLEAARWIKGDWEKIDPAREGRPKRKFYRLTATGRDKAEKALIEHHVSLP